MFDGLGALSPDLQQALTDSDPRVREQAIRLRALPPTAQRCLTSNKSDAQRAEDVKRGQRRDPIQRC